MFVQTVKAGTLFRVMSLGEQWLIILIQGFEVEAWKDGKFIGRYEVSPEISQGRTFYLYDDGPKHMIHCETLEVGIHDPMRCVSCKETTQWKDWIDRKCPQCGYDPYGKGVYERRKDESEVPEVHGISS